MSYKIIDIEGVGEAYAAKLQAAGIETAEDLLEAGLTEVGRETIAQRTGIPQALINRWVNHSNLFRIDGVGPQFAELLDASGVTSVEMLRSCNAEELEKKLLATNEARRLTRRVPSAKELQKIIDCSKQVETAISY